MKPRLILRTGVTASALAHLSVLMLIAILFRGASVQFGHRRADHGRTGFVRRSNASPDRGTSRFADAETEPSDGVEVPSTSPPGAPAPAPLRDGAADHNSRRRSRHRRPSGSRPVSAQQTAMPLSPSPAPRRRLHSAGARSYHQVSRHARPAAGYCLPSLPRQIR